MMAGYLGKHLSTAEHPLLKTDVSRGYLFFVLHFLGFFSFRFYKEIVHHVYRKTTHHSEEVSDHVVFFQGYILLL